MRGLLTLTFCSIFVIAGKSAALAQDCQNEETNLGVERTVTLDAKNGGLYGTFQYPDSGLLKEGEVILTFDDGPHPKRTRSILRSLARYCTKATFFTVGQMARSHPETLKAVSDAGHTVGTHTWRHVNMQATSFKKGVKDVERGFAAAHLATDGKVAPFFRFPRLRHTKKMRDYFAKRHIAVFSVDVISGDTKHFTARRIVRQTLSILKKKRKGILLFHDLKKATAKAIPTILAELKKRGFKVVHIVPKEYIDVDALIASNASIENSQKNVNSAQSLASYITTSSLDAYFGPTWPKRVRRARRKVRKQYTKDTPPAFTWPFD